MLINKYLTMNLKNNQTHPFHIVDPSPWPIVAAIGGLTLTTGGVMYMHNYANGGLTLILGFNIIFFVMFTWWRDVIKEGTYEGQHTKAVQRGLRIGMVLFIVSEVMFFFAFFWAFFHSSLSPVYQIGGVWPPVNFPTLSPWRIPLLNTILLVTSGLSVTWAHAAVKVGAGKEALKGLFHTIVLALLFTSLQAFEYISAPFTISDSVYGSCFYLTTGFHGFHVLVGTIFLIVCTLRLLRHHFTTGHHIGLESAVWYWHFVDVVWIFLFITIYWWGN
jgi:cytochrome c oxidase subunit 3